MEMVKVITKVKKLIRWVNSLVTVKNKQITSNWLRHTRPKQSYSLTTLPHQNSQ